MTEHLGFMGRAYKYQSGPFWQLTYGTRSSGHPGWYLTRREEGQPAVEVAEHRWAISDAKTLWAWLRANGVSEAVTASFLRGIERHPPPSWQDEEEG